MFLQSSFGKTLDMVHRAMDVALIRRDIIANNIANSDTPNFKRSVLNFESELKRALESEQRKTIPAFLTHEKHIPFHRPVDYRTVKPRKVLDYLTTSKNNGNNVDIEEEMMNALHNQLQYQLMTMAVSNQFSQINLVLR
ncbi:MAG: flagellar basal body rod protein FlgB [Spirochaetes bacterium]|nr:MAG: flagellar basal body rod protein FlgB [Spirochaetota bacterium]